ncbi:MAG TPA: valine--tRNA ligase [Candidatus Absconditabacterales bacterium]|nr:valine--tRNA ligase [Candidatus Absconditabacterales bacterium]
MSFPSRFDPKREQAMYMQSVKAGHFKPEINADRSDKTFVVPVPPPNVTGVLHVGHALFVTLQDAFCRYHRMQGKQVLRVPGTDHAGISTQVQVEKKLKKEKDKTRHDIGRVDFLKQVWEFATYHRHGILDQFKLLGASMDRDREQFTLSESLSRAVRKSFKNLYDKGNITLGYRIANRCTRCQTVLSDAEVEMETHQSKIYKIRYFLVGGKNNTLEVLTTRPETIPADVALAVHPQDKRYKSFIGKEVMVPFVNRKIPIIADNAVDMNFGTGVLKITPAHDPLDFEIGLRNNLPLDVFALDKQGKRAGTVPEFGGYMVEGFFDTYIDRLKEIGNLIEVQDHENVVPHCERCNTRIEPMASEQRFVDVSEYAKKTLHDLDSKDLQVYPERMGHLFHQWLDHPKPWCISRQLWWGHRIPVWHNDQGQMAVVDEDVIYEYGVKAGKTSGIILSMILFNLIADNKIDNHIEFQDLLDVLLKPSMISQKGSVYKVYCDIYRIKFSHQEDILHQVIQLESLCSKLENNVTNEQLIDQLLDMVKNAYGVKYQRQFLILDIPGIMGIPNIKQHEDVLDTWFSSGLWPMSIMGWPEKTTDFDRYFPTTLLETAYDILFPWVCRMVMMSYANCGIRPFDHVYFHGLIRDEHGAKMSKSKGNVVDPLEVMKEYGTDALRLSLIANNPAGSDFNYHIQKADYYSRFMTKLWNASRYVWLNAVGDSGDMAKTSIDLEVLKSYINDHIDQLNDFDKWILYGLDDLIYQSIKGFESYAITQQLDEIVKFIRNNFCDWYIEIAKLQKHDLTEKILLYSIGTILKLLHPYAPFVTQALYYDMGFGDDLCIASFPTPFVGSHTMSTQTKLFMDIIGEFRNLRQHTGIKSNEKITAVIKANTSITSMIKEYEQVLCKIVNCQSLILLTVNQDIPQDVITKPIFDIVIGIQTIVPIDIKSQIKKLEEQLLLEEKFISDLQSLLNSEGFKQSAPESIKQTKMSKLEEVKLKVQQIQIELQRLKYL